MEIDEDRVTGNYNRFWDERNYVNWADRIQCSVFGVQGLNDWECKADPYASALAEASGKRCACASCCFIREIIFMSTILQALILMTCLISGWRTGLYDIDNDVMQKIPNVMVESNLDCTQWDTDVSWPFKASGDGALRCSGWQRFSAAVRTASGSKQPRYRTVTD